MTSVSLTKMCIAVLALGMMQPAVAWSKDNDHGKGKKHGHEQKHDKPHDKHSRGHGDNDRDVVIVIDDSDKRIIRRYYSGHQQVRHCPPGLAKKNPSCMPPGQYKKYVRGDILPGYVTWHPVPDDLLILLHPAPHGARYVMVDQNVLLISEATKKVLDAVVLMSAVQ